MDHRWQMLEDIYKEAREEVTFGHPVVELAADNVSVDATGRIFADLRAIIDQMQVFVAKGLPEGKAP